MASFHYCLSTISTDILGHLCNYLPTSDIAALFATLDRRMQRNLLANDVRPRFTFDTSYWASPLQQYFSTHCTNASEVSIISTGVVPNASVDFLVRQQNLVSLVFNAFINPAVLPVQYQISLLHFPTFINFSAISSKLTSITLDNYSFWMNSASDDMNRAWVRKFMSLMPPTLLRLKIVQDRPNLHFTVESFAALPRSLTDLHLESSTPLYSFNGGVFNWQGLKQLPQNLSRLFIDTNSCSPKPSKPLKGKYLHSFPNASEAPSDLNATEASSATENKQYLPPHLESLVLHHVVQSTLVSMEVAFPRSLLSLEISPRHVKSTTLSLLSKSFVTLPAQLERLYFREHERKNRTEPADVRILLESLQHCSRLKTLHCPSSWSYDNLFEVTCASFPLLEELHYFGGMHIVPTNMQPNSLPHLRSLRLPTQVFEPHVSQLCRNLTWLEINHVKLDTLRQLQAQLPSLRSVSVYGKIQWTDPISRVGDTALNARTLRSLFEAEVGHNVKVLFEPLFSPSFHHAYENLEDINLLDGLVADTWEVYSGWNFCIQDTNFSVSFQQLESLLEVTPRLRSLALNGKEFNSSTFQLGCLPATLTKLDLGELASPLAGPPDLPDSLTLLRALHCPLLNLTTMKLPSQLEILDTPNAYIAPMHARFGLPKRLQRAAFSLHSSDATAPWTDLNVLDLLERHPEIVELDFGQGSVASFTASVAPDIESTLQKLSSPTNGRCVKVTLKLE